MIAAKVVLASPAERARVLTTIATVFEADAAFRFLFPVRASHARDVAAFSGALFDKCVARGTAWVVDGGSSIALWDRPAEVGEEDLPDRPGPTLSAGATARLQTYGEIVHGKMPSPHWYLSVLATDPAHAGRGWGRAVMAAGLDEAAKTGMPAYLEMSNPRNVAMYQRAGWTVAERVNVLGLPVWIMVQRGTK
ncbi:GNAT family N-acetyltransferase [Kribbella sp. NPDC004536]|uniref:GNAT family N-acetyltransferase n=1 Tax=Kribbella sp. NPDC004536 TaxID=3364106 RepID=UPI0036A5009B